MARLSAASRTCRPREMCGSEMRERMGLRNTQQGPHDDFRAHTDPSSVVLYPNVS